MKARRNSESDDDGPLGPSRDRLVVAAAGDGSDSLVEGDEEGTFGLCALCRRMEVLTRHHLIPKSRHRKARMRRQYSRQEMRERLMLVCRPCHNSIHRALSEQELAETYNTPELIAAHPEVERFTRWISRKPSGFVPP